MVTSASDGFIPQDTSEIDSQLIGAAQCGDLKLIDKLIDDGAQPDGSGAFSTTALMHAIMRDQYAAAALLIARGADVHHANFVGETAFSTAAQNKDPNYLRLLFLHCEREKLIFTDDYNPLLLAARNNKAKHIAACIDGGMDINATDGNEWTALHHAYVNRAHQALKFLLKAQAKIPPYFLAFAGNMGLGEDYKTVVKHIQNRTARQTLRMSRLKRIKTPGFRA